MLQNSRSKRNGLQREQLVAWFREDRAIPNPVIGAYRQGLLITGPRREELAALHWEDVDFKWRSLVLNEARPTARQLARFAREEETWEPSPWVFASPRSEDGKLAEPRIAHNKALKAAGISHVTIQGLRGSFGTLSEWVECPGGCRCADPGA